MTRLVVTADAETDVNEIIEYLTREAGARVAHEYGHRFRQTIELLVEFPRLGPPRPTLGADAHIGIVRPYVIIYDYTSGDDTITLLRVIHGKRNITRKLIVR